jgi:hypothetical protein
MADIEPGKGYREDEETYQDEFFNSYTGKYYDDATEILSMGMDYMFNPRLIEEVDIFIGENPLESRGTIKQGESSTWDDIRLRNYVLGVLATARPNKVKV